MTPYETEIGLEYHAPPEPLWRRPDIDLTLIDDALYAIEHGFNRADTLRYAIGRRGAAVWKLVQAHEALPDWEKMRPNRDSMRRAWPRAFRTHPPRSGVQQSLEAFA